MKFSEGIARNKASSAASNPAAWCASIFHRKLKCFASCLVQSTCSNIIEKKKRVEKWCYRPSRRPPTSVPVVQVSGQVTPQRSMPPAHTPLSETLARLVKAPSVCNVGHFSIRCGEKHLNTKTVLVRVTIFRLVRIEPVIRLERLLSSMVCKKMARTS